MAITLNKLKKEEIKKMSFKDIFLTPEYFNDLVGLMNTACLRVGLKKPVRLVLNYMPEDGDIAYTDGNTIYINLGAKFASRLKEKPVLFHIYIIGLLAHELGHIFWTEFEDGMTYMESIQKGTIYPSIPNHKNAQKFKNSLSVVVNRQIFQQICHTVDNILEDIYVNALQAEMLGGLYSKGINLGNIMITEEMLSIEQQKEEGYYDFNIIMNCLLTKLKSGSVIYGHYDSEYQATVEKIEVIANKYIFKPSHKERVEGINLIICELWDYIEDLLKDVKQNASNNSGNGGNSSGNNGNSSGSSSNNNSDGSTDNNSAQNSGNAGGQDNANPESSKNDDTSVGSSSGKSDNADNENDDKEGQQDTSNGTSSQEENGDDSSSSGSSKSDETKKNGDNANSTSGSDDNKSNSSSNENEGEIDNDLLNEILKKVIDQLQGQTQESQNQQDSNIAGQQKATPQTPALDDSLKESLNEKVEMGRFPISAGEAIAAEGAGSTTYEKLSPAEVESRRKLNDLIDRLSDDRAIRRNTEMVSQEMAQEVEDIDFGDIHSNINKTIFRVSGNSSDAKRTYETIKKQVLPISNKLEKVILRTIKEENLTGERRGRYYGKLLDTSRLYRPDIKVFKDRKQPKKEIDSAFYLLVDISGSMYGTKISTARLVSVLFAEVCEKLNIPLEITGHTTVSGGRGIGLYNFISYNSLNKNDKYSLAYMEDKYANRDGAAIIYGCERLLKRPEQKKVFCIISDGQPADCGYSGETAKSDMKHIKNKYTKDGIVFCAAAIDSDKEFIKEIFGKNFLNISHLESLPQTFGKILQNSVLE